MRDLKKIDPATRARILDAIRRYVETDVGDVRLLKGHAGWRRLRVGDWRVMHRYRPEDGVIEVDAVLHRSKAYR